jgi:regulator of protease activity HflC (stomatin/prohibitin superfamily)
VAQEGKSYENAIWSHLYPEAYERGIQETLGKYNRFVMPGLGFQIPLIHILSVRDIREHTMDIHPQPIIT